MSRKRKKTSKLKIIPIGGLHEIGKNMTAIEYGDDILIIDCGMSFPDNDMLGIDVVIPDFSYLREHADKIKGMIVTHAHEDHIGAVPYFLQEFNTPIYSTKLTLGFIESRLSEYDVFADLREIKPGDIFDVGCFRIETLHTTHSVADSVAFAIDTPVGKIFHTGDFKIDLTPIDMETIDFSRFAKLGDEGILLLMADSTNAERVGHSKSEREVGLSLEHIFKETKERIIIATFSSNVHRVQKIIDLAAKEGRKIAVSGRSIENMVKIATDLGYMTIPADSFIDINQIKNYNDNELLIITTGSQGEPMSALTRMANGEHRQVKIKAGDVVIFSSSPVPGNEKTVNDVLNALMEKGAKVLYNEIVETHASGHACIEELKMLQKLLKPKFFMPVHGEFKHMVAHKEIAMEMGVPEENIFILGNGNVLELNDSCAAILDDKVPTGMILVDGLGVGDVGAVVLNERKGLAEGGLIAVTVVYDRATGELIAGPEIHTRGFTYVKEYGQLLIDIQEVTRAALEDASIRNITATQELRNVCKHAIQKYLSDTMNRHPVVLPIVIKI